MGNRLIIFSHINAEGVSFTHTELSWSAIWNVGFDNDTDQRQNDTHS